MNYIVTAKPMHLPISLDQAATRPITPIADLAGANREARQPPSSTFVYRGELLEAAAERAYRPAYNLQISPENRRAISSYQKIAEEPPVLGKILDGFV